jgi:hypothetical protein
MELEDFGDIDLDEEIAYSDDYPDYYDEEYIWDDDDSADWEGKSLNFD